MIGRPARDEAAEYYFRYIEQVTAPDILGFLAEQQTEALALLRQIPEARSLHRYAPGKWSIKEVIGHLNDTERLFTFRAFWFARGFDTPLPSFDQLVAAEAATADSRSWSDLLLEFATVRAASLTFYRGLPTAAWERRGIASGNPFTVRALAWLTAGHVIHHLGVLRERYLTDVVG
ncbi:MAG TPA: DinB family protein [Gemmatimonadales bacterium]|nr:DinB family protein [Gemmatimonadales bacterium]